MQEITWKINHICNFDCIYCYCSKSERLQIPKLLNSSYSERAVQFFNSFENPIKINLTGGEPFLFPNFVNLCKNITIKNLETLTIQYR